MTCAEWPISMRHSPMACSNTYSLNVNIMTRFEAEELRVKSTSSEKNMSCSIRCFRVREDRRSDFIFNEWKTLWPTYTSMNSASIKSLKRAHLRHYQAEWKTQLHEWAWRKRHFDMSTLKLIISKTICRIDSRFSPAGSSFNRKRDNSNSREICIVV